MNRYTRTFALLLAAALQILPLLRNIVTSPAASSSFAIILRWTIGSTAALSAVDAVSGATTVFTSPNTFSGSVGTYFSNNVVCSIGGGNKAAADDYFYLQSGTVTSALLLNGQTTTVTLPPGLIFKSSWVNGATTIGGIIYGTPTTAGSYPTAVWIVSPGNAQLAQNITITIGASTGPVAPAITSQPAAATVSAGKTATFTVAASGTAPLGYFWSKGGAPLANGGTLSGASTATLTISNVAAGDAGNYSVVVSNSVSTATSTAAALTVIIPPAITSPPAGLSVATGSSAQFAVTASGTAPLSYRWLKGGIGLTNGVKFSGVNSNLLTIAAIATTDAGNYSVAVTNLAGSITSSVAALTVVSAPAIVTPPANQTVVAGAGASFTVTATGSTPLFYHWLKNAGPLADGGNVSGSTTATLTLSAVGSGDAASYSASVSNSLGSVTSSAATLTVNFAPAIVTPPAAATVLTGTNASFTVTASGTAPLNYQWLKNGTAISGATSATLSLVSVSATDAANYSVIVTNIVSSITSGSAALTVLAPPAITSQPANATLAQGGTASFSASASGTAPLNFQWLKNGSAIPGANSNVLTLSVITTNDAANYSVTVTNVAGSTTSSAGTLTVLVPPAITAQPLAASVVAGTNVAFTVTAGGSAPLTYQWLKNGTAIAGATSATLALANVSATNAANYSVTVTNTVGSATSSNASLTVLGPPAITSQPANLTVTQGNPGSFSATASGTAPLTFQWLKNGSVIPGANSNVLTFSAVTTNDAASYSVTVTNIVGSVTSGSATLTVLVPPAIVTQPANATSVTGSNVSFTVTASGSATLAYQWSKNGTPLTNGGNVSGATTATLSLAGISAADAANYSVTVTNAAGSSSSSATLTVLGPPTITTQPANVTVALGGAASFNVTAGGTAPLNFQWLKNGGVIPGANSNGLTFSTVTTNDAANYSVIVTNMAGNATSGSATLTVLVPPAIVAQPANALSVVGSNITVTVTASGSAALAYQWSKNGTPLANGGNVSGATSPTLALANVSVTDAATYSVTVTNAVGSATSANAALTVQSPPSIVTQPASQFGALGSTISVSVTATGTGPLNYQWFKGGIALGESANIVGSTSNILTIVALTTNEVAAYFVVVSNVVGSVTSTSASVSDNAAPVINAQPASQVTARSNTVVFTVNATGTGPLAYQWSKNGTNLIAAANISGVASSTLTLANVTTNNNGNYSVTITNLYGKVTSSNASLAVFIAPQITASPTNRTVAVGTNVTFAVGVSGTGPLNYQWFKDGGALADGGNISGSTSNILKISALTVSDNGGYSVIVSNLVGSAASASAALIVVAPPAITTQPANQSAVAGNAVTFNVTATGTAPLSYQWRKAGSAIAGATGASYTIASVKTNDAAAYTVVVTNLAGSVTSSGATLTVFVGPFFTTQPTNRSARLGTNTIFRAAVAGTAPMSYQWFKDGQPLVNGGNISGVFSNVLTVASLTTNNLGAYSLTATNLAGSATSSNAVLTVLVPPTIVEDLSDEYGVSGHPVTFHVKAVGTETMKYQWRKAGRVIRGATNTTYTISSVKRTDVAVYSVVINNPVGKVTSANAALKLVVAPTFTLQAGSRTATNGTTTVFRATVTGTAPLSYQWFKGGKPLVNGGTISGVTSNILTVSRLTSKSVGAYSLTVSNLAGTASSSNAVLTVRSFESNLSLAPAPLLISQIVQNANGGITLNCTGAPDGVYILQATSDLAAWSNLSTNTADSNGQWQTTDTAGAPSRFYRIRTAP